MPMMAAPSTLKLLCRCLSENAAIRADAIGELVDAATANAVLELAATERVLPSFYLAVAQLRGGLTKGDRVALAIGYEANRRKNRRISEAFLEIADEAHRLSIEVAVLKGARWIAEDQVDYAAWRTMIDIDLLVRPENSQAMREVLRRLGYRSMRLEETFFAGRRFEGHYHLVAHRRDDDPFSIEVHRHLGWRPMLLPNELIFQGSRKIAPGLNLPCPWHGAFHAIVHWQSHHYGYQLGIERLRDGIEVAKFLQRDDVDWDAAARQAEEGGLRREFDAALATASELFGARLPPSHQLSNSARSYVAKALKKRGSRLLMWKAKQRQRIVRLWYDDRFKYRMALRRAGRWNIILGLWGLRLRRTPFLVSHCISIGFLEVARLIQKVRGFA